MTLEVQFCLSPIRTQQDEPGRGGHLMLPMAVAMLSALTQRPGREGTAVLGEFGTEQGLCVPQLRAGAWLVAGGGLGSMALGGACCSPV